jgi:SAM-dependent methyltransferase
MLRRIFFSLWYLFSRPPWDTGVSPPELMAHIESHPPGRALDLGCGTGTNALTLAKRGWQVTGVDFAQPAIQSARAKATRAGLPVEFLAADVTRLENIQGSFDLVLDIGCFHTLDQPGKQRYTANLQRFLAPGGTYLLYAFFKEPGDEGSGLIPADLSLLEEKLQLEQRVDGSERGRRASSWFTYRLKAEQ